MLTTTDLINTFQYLFDFPPGTVDIASSNFSNSEKYHKMLFWFPFKSQHRRHADGAPQELQTAISGAQYLRINNAALKVTRYLFASTNMVTFLRCRCLITFPLAYSETA